MDGFATHDAPPSTTTPSNSLFSSKWTVVRESFRACHPGIEKVRILVPGRHAASSLPLALR